VGGENGSFYRTDCRDCQIAVLASTLNEFIFYLYTSSIRFLVMDLVE